MKQSQVFGLAEDTMCEMIALAGMVLSSAALVMVRVLFTKDVLMPVQQNTFTDLTVLLTAF